MTGPPLYDDPHEVPDYARLLRMDGRRFVILGTGAGLGRQSAHALRAHGARIVCIDLKPGAAEQVAKEVSGLAITADITDRDQLTAAIEQAEAELGGIDGLIDIVGGNRSKPLLELDDDDWTQIFRMCFDHARLAVDIVGKAMLRSGGGTMAFVGSYSAYDTPANNAAYAVAKRALSTLVKAAGLELGQYGIRVNAVAPTMIASPRFLAAAGDNAQPQLAQAAKQVPTGRVNSTRDVAGVLLFLSSDLARNVSGQTIVVSGGKSG